MSFEELRTLLKEEIRANRTDSRKNEDKDTEDNVENFHTVKHLKLYFYFLLNIHTSVTKIVAL